MGVYERYRNVDYALPKTYRSWDLFGAGLENLGRDRQAVELPLRDPNPDEVLLRVDALGLCFSDAKLIWAGPDHPRIPGRDLANDPTVAGHEAALTVVKAGSNWKNRFPVGGRYIIQADIKIGGVQKAFGYVQRGAMAQYAYAGPWVLDGDGVCYLIPMRDHTGYVEAALVEPWACVEAAYDLKERTAPVAGGKALVVFASPGAEADFSGVYSAPPAKLTAFGAAGRDLSAFGIAGDVRGEAAPELVKAAAEAAGGFDDIFLVGAADAALIEACDVALAAGGILCFLASGAIPGKAALDIGRAHYHLTRYVGSGKARAKDAYGQNVRTELKAGGRAWMVGAAGPMGQMHVQRALELENPPAGLYCTDLSQERLDYMAGRLKHLAEKKGVELVVANVGGMNDLDDRLNAFTGNGGFDDIYVHAPVPALVEHAAGFLGDRSVFNIFAGVGIGTKAKLSPDIFCRRHTRLVGSSGSSMDDIVNTLGKMEAGRLATRMSLAAIGGIGAVWDGVKGVKENRFPGKTAILPQLDGIPLTGLNRLSDVSPEATDRMEPGCVWTNDAEKLVLEKFLKI
ncbi:MAG: alcohol dehydrogenase catalytic domain-containing protein [Planctomycetota bacterium]|jgi:threonine dehydrogenase-like Zn-dependent dehydrogenase|nr:alcohol dehydrogenase catalytic domain-containing protein [Planctomycetota bacterium]